jgi:hypothetical protein
MSDVLNLSTGKVQHYSCPPQTAVVCADEQSRGNYNTWDYDLTRARLINDRTWVCGDHTCPKEPS